MEIIALLGTGLLVGLLTSMLGIGGGVVIIPMLYFIFPKASGSLVIATSLAIILLTSITNCIYFILDKKLPHIKFLLRVAIPMLIGIILGKDIMLRLDTRTLQIIFALCLLPISFKMLLDKKDNVTTENLDQPSLSKIGLRILGYLGAGLLSGLTGLGGGVVLIPLYKYLEGIELKRMPAHTLPVIAIVAAYAVFDLMLTSPEKMIELPDYFQAWQVGHVNVGIAVLLAFFAAISAKIGQKLMKTISISTLKYALVILLTLTSIKMLIG